MLGMNICLIRDNSFYSVTILLCHCSFDFFLNFFTISLFERAMLTELHLSVYWHTVRGHISCGSLAGLIANKFPVVQECNYPLTQIILLAGSLCLCSGRATPGTESSHNLTLTP